MTADVVYVALPSEHRTADEPEVYHDIKDCRGLSLAGDVEARPREEVADLEYCQVCAGADLTGAARVLAQADPDEYPVDGGGSA